MVGLWLAYEDPRTKTEATQKRSLGSVGGRRFIFLSWCVYAFPARHAGCIPTELFLPRSLRLHGAFRAWRSYVRRARNSRRLRSGLVLFPSASSDRPR